MATNFDKFQKLLEELFQLDQADLDFGIYRIMNQKRDEVVRFLEKDLLPQVKEAFSQYKSADKTELQKELDKLVKSITDAGMNPDDSPKVQELRQQMADSSVDVTALENEVFSHLFSFFRRYYHEGDFLSLRRYKEGVYAIPYEGEEVKLHWANHDQYYVKSSEYFRDYIFTMPSGKRVRVHLVAASTEQDNKKEAPGNERRFVLCNEDPIYEENGELFIRFEYRPDDGKKKQDTLNKEAIERVLGAEGVDDWIRELSNPAPTKANPNRTVLERHLTQYTARNTFDYFIHKDLGGFLRRELDFYIKNEVMHLDDIEHDTVPRVEQYLSKIKVIRRIAHKIIQFLEQLENFQKKLWLKKKFVLETNYCITLDRVPEELYEEIAANDAQHEEWVKLFAINEIEKDLISPGYSNPLTVEFLRSHSFLSIETRHFRPDFKSQVVSSIDDLAALQDGLLVNADSFQATSLLNARYAGTIDTAYNDPPYNTDASEILYKNGYRNSSWCSLIAPITTACHRLLSDEGILCTTIDDQQVVELTTIIKSVFGDENMLGTVSVRSNPSGRITLRGLAQCHEYALFFSKTRTCQLAKLPRSEDQLARFDQEDNTGRFEWRNFRRDGSSSTRSDRPKQFFPMFVTSDSVRIPEVQWNEVEKQYDLKEEPQEGESILWPLDSNGDERCWRWGIETAQKQLSELAVKTNPQGQLQIYNKYRPNLAGVLPLTIWTDKKYSSTEYGTGLVKNIFGSRTPFDFPKSLFATKDCVHVSSIGSEGTVLDCFGGSGTTGHAVISLNRDDGGSRKYVLLEMGAHFDSVLIPRLKKVVYAPDWRNGKPVNRDKGISHCYKYIRLESYEDTLSNLELKRTQQQASLLDADDELREQYVLSYMLDMESRGSQSLLNVESFRNPDQYKLKVERNGETQLVNVDLVETFNWLLGLTVKHLDLIRGVRVVEGTNPEGERVLVLWRNLDETDNDALDEWFRKQDYNTKDQEYDLIYVNGDNNLENLRRGDQTWKVRLTEEEFQRLMFDVEDV